MSRLRRIVRDESGFSLVLTLSVLLVLSLTTGAVVTATAVNHRSSLRSTDAEKAFALAQQGLAYAEGRLYTSPTTAGSVLVPGTEITPADDRGTIHYSGTLCDSSSSPPCNPRVWTLYGTGTVDGVSRTVSAQVTIPTNTTTYATTTTVTGKDFSMWNYVYIDGGPSCTAIAGSTKINVPVYTHGSICMSGNSSFTGSDLEIGGSLSVSGGSANIGSKTARISRMNVVGACTPAPCDGSSKPIWVFAPGVGHSLMPPNVTKPVVDLPGTYANADPGPLNPCQAGSNVPAHFFDNDTTLNRSDGSINLFPSGHPYDCVIGSNELRWDGAGSFHVNGTFYFDGDLAPASTHVVYTGKGTLYFTGTITGNSNTYLCGVSDCSAAGWEPATNAIVLVAGCRNSSGGTITSGCVVLNGGFTLQAGIYSNTDYNINGGAVNMGPVVTSTATFLGDMSQLIPLHDPPPGTPGDPTTTTITTTTTMTTDGSPSSPGGWSG
jgi:Tfp pilus assembly protein PilX